MFKLFSLKTFSAIALSLSMLVGTLVALPVTSAFAKIPVKTAPKDYRSASYSDRNIDNDGDELNESSETPYVVVFYPTYNRRADGKWTIGAGK